MQRILSTIAEPVWQKSFIAIDKGDRRQEMIMQAVVI